MITQDERIESFIAAKELFRRKASSEFKYFVLWIKKDYDMQWFHEYICMKLQQFAEGKIKKLMILIPPQHGKSELATRLFPPYLLGKFPNKKIAITSYGHSMASGFNRDIQRNIDTEKYGQLFPGTKLNGSKIFGTNRANYVRNDHQFDIIDKTGGLRSVGRGGALTGATVDIGIIDDLYKDRDEARSVAISEGAWSWYVDVFRTRLHNDSQQLIMNTRWDENDLAGRLLEEEAGEWEVIKFPAIRTQDVIPYDPRNFGEVLWEKKHSLAKILSQKKLGEASFNSLYQQDPKPNSEVLIYKNWIELPEWPVEKIGSVTYGLDFGKTTGTWALIRCSMTAEGIFFDELLYKKPSTSKEVYAVLTAMGYEEGQIVYCDFEPVYINELILMGVTAMPAIKGPGSVRFGIRKLNEIQCHYTKKSVHLIREKNRYQYMVLGKVIFAEPDPNCVDHAMDACRYGTVARFFTGEE